MTIKLGLGKAERGIFLCYSHPALSLMKHNTQPTNALLLFFLDIYYNLCKLVKHVSIPSWDHHQGLGIETCWTSLQRLYYI
jgi:hypothetical protein